MQPKNVFDFLQLALFAAAVALAIALVAQVFSGLGELLLAFGG